jgi:hypothetical protein
MYFQQIIKYRLFCLKEITTLIEYGALNETYMLALTF